MIRITSLDMPKNDYFKFVRKVIYELNLRDEKDTIDEFPQDKHGAFNSPKKSILNHTDDINSNSVLEIKNILESDGKIEDEDSTPAHKKEEKKGFSKPHDYPNKGPKANKDFMTIKENKEVKDVSIQMTPKPAEPPKVKKRDFGVLVQPQKATSKKTHTATVSCATDLTMNSKELTSMIAGLHIEETKQKQYGKKSKHQNHLEEFQDIEFMKARPDSRHHSKGRKRQKSSEKQKKNRSKGHSYDSLKHGSKVGANTPE